MTVKRFAEQSTPIDSVFTVVDACVALQNVDEPEERD
jgi:hypothetical protein